MQSSSRRSSEGVRGTGVSSGSSVVHLVHPAVHLVRLVRLAVVDKASP